jgi:alcohol dehydrogenase, propanol-preferring
MKAAVYRPGMASVGDYLRIEEVDRPSLSSGHLLLRVLACGVYRTDLHIVEGELPPC